MQENIPPNESHEQLLIKLLREKGPANPEARAALIDWTEQQEAAVLRAGTAVAQVHFERERARLYFAAGFIEEANTAYEHALTQAWGLHESDLYEEIKKEKEEK